MLIQFSVSNWRSVKENQTLSLVLAKGTELIASNSFTPTAPATPSLLRSAAIYGANAAGKSNLLRAMQTMKKMVMDSSKGQRGDLVPVTSFLLDSATEESPSEFEVFLVADGVRYQYGFSATPERIHEEWLFAYPNGRSQKWLGRAWDAEKKVYQWEKCNALTGQKQLWQDSTRENALFLSTAVQLNSKQLQPVYDWFKKTLRLANVSGWSPSFTASLCKDSEQSKKVLAFLQAADLDIQDVIIESEKMSAKHFPDDMPDELKTTLLAKMQDSEVLDIKTVHRSLDGRAVSFDFRDESDGTQKFFAFAGPWLDALKNGFVLVIDELHDNLHPKMVQFLVQLFHNSETNPKNAQLVFTTHETSILNQDVFRRDQIWFCEKDDKQSTRLYPLTDFKPRKERENLEASYLAGRYGALPYLRSVSIGRGVPNGER
ncbi:AAA family ATPase [Candidatus Accumulibacter contiguus]|jgi:AAA15 family ATPase/GTPase|uniref:AAA family ATPase n=1 Tax=Candidatus Accumulibacter contiguus TaxID=2954381 RepID=UPI002FC3C547